MARFLLLALALVLAAAPALAKVYSVSWVLPTATKPTPFASTLTIKAADSVVFTWTADPTGKILHDIQNMTGVNNFKSCSFKGAKQLYPKTGGPVVKGTYTLKGLKKGTYYIACSAPGHCAAKQKMTLTVQ